MPWTNISPKITPLNQPTTSTCWLSCLQMLYIWKGKDAGDVLKDLNADPDIFPDYWVINGVAPYNCLQIARSLKLGCAGDGEPDADVLEHAIATHGPYWVAGEWIKGSPHVQVVTGINLSTGKIRMFNPWKNYDLSETEDLFDNFKNRGKIWNSTFGSMIYWSLST